MSYTEFLEGLQLRYFAPQEITSYAERERNGAKNGLPPEVLWKNIVPTLWVLDQLRELFESPITLTSIYRNDAYNRAVGGATNSYHKRNQAIDFQVRDVSPVKVDQTLKEWRTVGVFRGGIGLYSTFVHIDTRGSNATWTG